MADVRADVGGTAEADLRVHVRAVHVDQAAVLMHDRADVPDALLEDAVRGRVGDHEGGQVVFVLGGLLLEVGEVDVAVLKAGHGHDVEPRHRRRGRIGAVSGDGDEAGLAPAAAARLMVGADDEQARVLALGPGVGLKADGGEARDLGQPFLELERQFLIALRLLGRNERVELAELGPGDGDHLGRRVELHGAGTQRDHGVRQREILALELAQIAQHLVLAAMLREYPVRQKRSGALERGGDRRVRLGQEPRRG